MYILYLILMLVILGLLKFYQPIIKGKIGETIVAFILTFLPKDKYKVINDVILVNENGTTQIDHIVVSKYAIFVIETKNYKGWIYGNEYASHWTKNMYGRKYEFHNPIRQNFAHIKTLSQLLKMDENKFISIVIFPISATLKSKYQSHVSYFFRVNSIIKKYKEEIVVENVDDIYNDIIASDKNDKEHRKKHIENVRKRINEIENYICPECGYQLVKKRSRFGYFIGCSNYPQCKYISKR